MREATLQALSKTSVDAMASRFCETLEQVRGGIREREALALELANELVRRSVEADLSRLSAGYGNEVVVDGRRYKRHASGVGRYHTLCGSVTVRRDSYRLVGVHNGPTVVPLDLEAGIVENATPALAASVVRAFAMMPLREYEAQMTAAHRSVPSRSTLERIAKRAGGAVRDDLPLIEPVLRARERGPEGGYSISIGVDRTTMPMAETIGRAPAKTTAHVRARPPRTVVAYRMAYVATIAINDVHGEALSTIRVSATASEGSTLMMERLGDELAHVMAQYPEAPIAIIQDGAPELWNLVRPWLQDRNVTPTVELIDRFHADERLAQTAEAIERDAGRRQRLIRRWRAMLDHDDGGISRICASIDRRLYERPKPADDFWPLAPRPKIHGENARIAEQNYWYFRRHTAQMRYASARAKCLPIGSGVTEGACKSVIGARFKRSGQRWFNSGASPCLHLRTLCLNQRLEPALAIVLDEQRARLGAY